MTAFRNLALLCLAAGVLAAGVLAACSKSSALRYDEPPAETLCSIAELKSRCAGHAAVVIAEELSVRGVVTGNDRYGEFSREIVIEDSEGGAIRIALDEPRTGDSFPFGALVTVSCNGLALGSYGGRILLGAAPDAAYGVSRIAAADIARYIRVEGQGPALEAPYVPFDALDAAWCDRYVRAEGVRFAERGAAWCDLDAATGLPVTTERTLVDASGGTFAVRTLGGCSYAAEPLPDGTGSLYAIVEVFAGRCSLRVTDRRILFRED